MYAKIDMLVQLKWNLSQARNLEGIIKAKNAKVGVPNLPSTPHFSRWGWGQPVHEAVRFLKEKLQRAKHAKCHERKKRKHNNRKPVWEEGEETSEWVRGTQKTQTPTGFCEDAQMHPKSSLREENTSCIFSQEDVVEGGEL